MVAAEASFVLFLLLISVAEVAASAGLSLQRITSSSIVSDIMLKRRIWIRVEKLTLNVGKKRVYHKKLTLSQTLYASPPLPFQL